MYVHNSHASGFTELQEHFGLPSTTSGMKEMFGEYCGGEAAGYWSHDPDTNIWVRHNTRYQFEFPLKGDSLNAVERENYIRASEHIADLAPPAMPDNRAVTRRDKPFLYMGWKFQWLFIPQLGRWELLPLGKLEAVSATISQH